MDMQPGEKKNFDPQRPEDDHFREWEQSRFRGKIFGGIIIVGIGALFLAREMGVIMPNWLFSWKVLLIVIGFFIGVKHAFRNAFWLIPILIGSAFLFQDVYPQFEIGNYVWPLAIIMFGLFMIFKPRGNYNKHYWKRRYGRHRWKEYRNQWDKTGPSTTEGYLEINSVFGSIQKNIISKDFKGGEINVVFGGAEINLTQADINGSVILEINTVFGGSQIIVPPHWEIKSELDAVMGGVEDRRPIYKDGTTDASKILILKGSVVFGGIEIRSY